MKEIAAFPPYGRSDQPLPSSWAVRSVDVYAADILRRLAATMQQNQLR